MSIAVDVNHEGEAATRNRALNSVQTEWTAFLDDDDYLHIGHLATCIAWAEASGADLVYPWFTVKGGIDPLACPDDTGVLRTPFGLDFGSVQREYLRTSNFIPVTTLVRTELAKSVGGFPLPETEEWPRKSCVDWGFLLRLLDAGATFQHAPVATWVWRHWGGNFSGRVW